MDLNTTIAMNQLTIDNLREALQHSPGNIPLRMLLAKALLQADHLEEAGQEYALILESHADPRAQQGLAQVYLQKGSYSACIILLEESFKQGQPNAEALILYAKALLQENDIQRAAEAYQQALILAPELSDASLDSQLRIRTHSDTPAEEDTPDSRFLEKPAVSFADVGGMESVKKEIELKIIRPLQHPELYKAYGKKTGGGILLYGPPGCGKTFIAKATAGEVKARFINVCLNDILDMWIGNSEKNLHEIFELARHNTPCVLFIDEIDALGASRSDLKQSAGRQLINQFLQELDGINHANEGVLVLGATNMPWNLDPAFRRPGRFDRILFIPPPDLPSREAILRLKLANKPTKEIDYRSLAQKTPDCSGADLDAIIDIAIEQKLQSAFADGIPQPLETSDLLQAAKKHKPSTQEWFQTARNFALFANDSGLYDDVLNYLKIKK